MRSFAIGKRTIEHARWQKTTFTGGYQSGDFEALVNRLRDDVRMLIYIKEDSVRVAEWTRAYVLRELVRETAGDETADGLTMHEYLAILGRALKFDNVALTGEIQAGWLDFIKTVAAHRATGQAIKSKKFDEMVKTKTEELKNAKTAALDPVAAAKQASREAIKNQPPRSLTTRRRSLTP